MKFSVIMQSYLGPYKGAAMDREKKIVRAVESVIKQTLQSFELIIVADGCEKTFDLISDKFKGNPKISVYLITKQEYWSGVPRTFGGMMAKGDRIIYLDIDDFYGPNHLESIDRQFGGYDWVFYNDWIYDPRKNKFKQRPCNIARIGYNGTSNICFKRSLNVTWDFVGYAHDYHFNQSLIKRSKKFGKIMDTGYYVCHLPHYPGGRGYDL